MRRLALALLLWVVVVGGAVATGARRTALPARPDSLKFAAIGDTGTGDRAQYDVGEQMATARARFPFELVIMLGDNMYGRQQPQDFVTKFERPYAALLSAGVGFYASLGNHDNPAQHAVRRLPHGRCSAITPSPGRTCASSSSTATRWIPRNWPGSTAR